MTIFQVAIGVLGHWHRIRLWTSGAQMGGTTGLNFHFSVLVIDNTVGTVGTVAPC